MQISPSNLPSIGSRAEPVPARGLPSLTPKFSWILWGPRSRVLGAWVHECIKDACQSHRRKLLNLESFSKFVQLFPLHADMHMTSTSKLYSIVSLKFFAINDDYSRAVNHYLDDYRWWTSNGVQPGEAPTLATGLRSYQPASKA